MNDLKQKKHVFSLSSIPNSKNPKFFRPKRKRNHIATSISQNSGSSKDYFKLSPSKIHTEFFPYYVIKEESIWKRHEKDQGILDKALNFSNNKGFTLNLSLPIQVSNKDINKNNYNNSLNFLIGQNESNSVKEVLENSNESLQLISQTNQKNLIKREIEKDEKNNEELTNVLLLE